MNTTDMSLVDKATNRAVDGCRDSCGSLLSQQLVLSLHTQAIMCE